MEEAKGNGRAMDGGTEWRMLYKAQTARCSAGGNTEPRLQELRAVEAVAEHEDRPLNAVALGPLPQKAALGARALTEAQPLAAVSGIRHRICPGSK